MKKQTPNWMLLYNSCTCSKLMLFCVGNWCLVWPTQQEIYKHFFFAETTTTWNIALGVLVKFLFTRVGNMHVNFATATSATTNSPRGYLINRLNVRPNHLTFDLWSLSPHASLLWDYIKSYILCAMNRRLTYHVRQIELVDHCNCWTSQSIGCINNNNNNNNNNNIISFIQGIYSYIPETNHVPMEYSVALFCCYYSWCLYR